MELITTVLAATPPDVNSFVNTARDFIAPIFLLIVGLVALSFLMRRNLTAFFQFFALTVLIGVLFYVPGIIEAFSTWASGLFFGGNAPK